MRLSVREKLLGWLDGVPAEAIPARLAEAQAVEAAAAGHARAAEAGGMLGVGSSRDDQMLLQQGFRQLTTGSLAGLIRQLPPLAQDRMLRLVYWLIESNPLARWLIQMTVDFVLGEGARVDTQDDGVKEVLERFWQDPTNDLDRRLDVWAFEYGLYGELCLPAFVNEIDGHVRLGYIDPFEIDQVLCDPENVLIRTGVLLKAQPGTGHKKLYKIIGEDTARVSPYYGSLMGALPLERDNVTGVPYDGSCFLFQTNKVSNARRGRSDLLPLIDWVDGYDQFLFDSMDNANLFNSFVYDVELQGYTEDQIKEWLAKWGAIKKGEVFAHNEKVKMSEVTPDLKAQDRNTFARVLRGHILGALGFPEHFYGTAGEVNLASAKEMAMPTVKRLTRRQKELKYVITTLLRFAVHQAQRVGRLPTEIVIGKLAADGSSQGTTKRVDQAFTVVLPELSMKDQASIVAAVNGLTASLMQAQAEGWVRPETAAKLFAGLISQLGFAINAEDEWTPDAPGGAGSPYSGGQLQRILAQLARQGNGNGDNINQPKATQDTLRPGDAVRPTQPVQP